MKGIIWYRNRDRAEEELEILKRDYSYYHISPIKVSKDYIVFDNGDEWRMVLASDKMHGLRCNISYIEYGISEQLVYTVIAPSTTASPWHGSTYF